MFLGLTPAGRAYLVNGEADGEEVGPQLPVLPPVLLHQGHQEAADDLGVLGVVVLLQELQAVLRVGPESVCAGEKRAFRPASWRKGRGNETAGARLSPTSRGSVDGKE